MAYPKSKNPFKDVEDACQQTNAGSVGRADQEEPYNQIDELNHRIAELEA